MATTLTVKKTGMHLFVWKIKGGSPLNKGASFRNRADTEDESRSMLDWWVERLGGTPVLMKKI